MEIEFTDVIELLESISQHVAFYGGMIVSYDNPGQSRLRFKCQFTGNMWSVRELDLMSKLHMENDIEQQHLREFIYSCVQSKLAKQSLCNYLNGKTNHLAL